MSEVVAEIEGRAGRIRLNRPKAIHALNEGMCQTITDALTAWRGDFGVEAILLDHAEGRGFCAGGDVRAVAESGKSDGAAARAFFRIEYRMNHLLFTFAKPSVAFMDGIVMGGGVGISLPCKYRVATANTLFAMPEATIGLFPDVGAGWYLSRLPGRTGQFLALTAARLDGAECLSLGLATHYLPAEALDGVKSQIAAAPQDVAAILDAAAVAPPAARIERNRDDIDRLFAADTLEEVLAALEADGGEWAAKELAALRSKSPQACKVGLRLIAAGKERHDFAEEMRVEYGVATHVCQRPDFIEGVRALLIDKDNAPRWDPATPEGVTDHMLDRIFAPLPDGEEWTPLT